MSEDSKVLQEVRDEYQKLCSQYGDLCVREKTIIEQKNFLKDKIDAVNANYPILQKAHEDMRKELVGDGEIKAVEQTA